MTDRLLEGRLILVLEDDYLAALDVAQLVEDLGGEVAGPAGRLEEARALARERPLDGAVLDVNLDRETSYPLARELLERGVAVVFLTGYEAGSIDAEFSQVPRLTKPYDARQGERILRRAFDR
jgi:DNA-binding LytR/AlgR family response regulator